MITNEYNKDNRQKITWLEHYSSGRIKEIIKGQVKTLLENITTGNNDWVKRWVTLKDNLKQIFWNEDPDQYEDIELEISRWFKKKMVDNPKAI